MPQTNAWEHEYQHPKLVTKKAEPQNDVKRFLKFLKKSEGISLEGLKVLDLGCGTGRNSNYLASLGSVITGMEISKTALDIAQQRAQKEGIKVEYLLQSIGDIFSFPDNSFELLLDITSSNSLNEKEREVYITESYRVLKSEGYFFVRALCKDGDTNVKNLLKESPGKEYDTYLNKEMNLIERVFSREDFIATYSPFFSVINLEKKSSYSRFNGRIYKRNYWLAYMKKV